MVVQLRECWGEKSQNCMSYGDMCKMASASLSLQAGSLRCPLGFLLPFLPPTWLT